MSLPRPGTRRGCFLRAPTSMVLAHSRSGLLVAAPPTRGQLGQALAHAVADGQQQRAAISNISQSIQASGNRPLATPAPITPKHSARSLLPIGPS